MNEEAVGKAVDRAVADGLASRDELFITTKLWVSNMKNEDGAYESLKASLAKLNLDYPCVQSGRAAPVLPTGECSCYNEGIRYRTAGVGAACRRKTRHLHTPCSF